MKRATARTGGSRFLALLGMEAKKVKASATAGWFGGLLSHLSDDETVAKMGHPGGCGGLEEYGDPSLAQDEGL